MDERIEIPSITITPSDRVYARLAILAAKHNRSLAAEVYDLVKMAVGLPSPTANPQKSNATVKRPARMAVTEQPPEAIAGGHP